MRLFTVIMLLIALPAALFAAGAREEEPMEAPAMSGSDAMMSSDSMMAASEMGDMGLLAPFPDFMGLEDARMMVKDGPTVLFFYATWCPTCKAAAKELKADPERLDGINLIIVDYDNSDDLQMKYGVTYQHTFVQIDESGMAVKKWNGGGIDGILANVEKEEMM